MERERSQDIYELLYRLDIPFTQAFHQAAMTMEDLAGVEEILDGPFCKNLFLCNRQKTEFYLLLMSGRKKFVTREVSKTIGKARLSFGGEDMLYELLGVRPGAITPMGLVFDAEHRINLLVDEDLRDLPFLLVHPCVNTESIKLRASDLWEHFLPYTGHEPNWIKIDGGAENEPGE